MTRLSARMTIAVVLALIVLPVSFADARTFKGRTSQGGGVLMKTNSQGAPALINIGWRAYCGRRGSVPSSTLIRSPVDRASRRYLYNSGKYGYYGRRKSRNYVKTRIRAVRRSARRWRGIFRVRITIKRGGKTLYRCRSRAIRWSARR